MAEYEALTPEQTTALAMRVLTRIVHDSGGAITFKDYDLYVADKANLSVLHDDAHNVIIGLVDVDGQPFKMATPLVGLVRGSLQLYPAIQRVLWKGQEVRGFTVAEFRVITAMARNDGPLTFRLLYDEFRGQPGFLSGTGDTGYHANVRTCMKRLRQKFWEADKTFDCIQNRSGFGYEWVPDIGNTVTALVEGNHMAAGQL
jgi:hypothetical protein